MSPKTVPKSSVLEKARECGPSFCAFEPEPQTSAGAFVSCASTFLVMTVGGFGISFSRFSSCVHSAATRVESSAWLEVSKRLIDLTTPSPASVRK